MSKRASKAMALPISAGNVSISATASRQSWRHKIAWLAVFAVSTLFLLRCSSHYGLDALGLHRSEPSCPQQIPLVPSADVLPVLEALYSSESFQNRSAAWLSGAVKIPTESYDDLLPVGNDTRWDVFGDLQAYLVLSFPLTFRTARITDVNKYNLVLHWEGSDPSLKPILLTAHQDVVPVEPSTISAWTHPPYSGYYDGEFIWGRGSSDDKSDLIGILSSIETLLEASFRPRRTVVAAFGIDEEASGMEGAGKLADYLQTTYGVDGFAFLVDEGGGISEESGVLVATPHVGEKGYLDVRVQISTPGGHSSVPPEHTGIGLLALAINRIESTPHEPQLTRTSPYYASLVCLAENVPDYEHRLKKLVRASLHSDLALRVLRRVLVNDPERGRSAKALLSTTQAVDLVEGGVKVNALPERSSAVVNHRISADSSLSELIEHLTTLLSPFAAEKDLRFISFGQNISSSSHSPSLSLFRSKAGGTLELFDAWGTALEPAPITPTDTSAYQLLSGTILATHANSVIPSTLGKDMIVAPGLAGGNTDTRFYWKLTRNIFRYKHMSKLGLPSGGGAHTVNEVVRADALVDNIHFITLLILNADESDSM